ncbi:hypothetical protein Scep_027176 [Stephania cephalantha]|uniref:Uncharacterized protein n=1 Tax=Stephania cephalantha TaxID=152367 RepID=A0AAP0EPQ7_9MAGN
MYARYLVNFLNIWVASHACGQTEKYKLADIKVLWRCYYYRLEESEMLHHDHVMKINIVKDSTEADYMHMTLMKGLPET